MKNISILLLILLQKIVWERPEKVFQKLLEQAEIAKFDRKEQMTYQDSLKYYRDLKTLLILIWKRE